MKDLSIRNFINMLDLTEFYRQILPSSTYCHYYIYICVCGSVSVCACVCIPCYAFASQKYTNCQIQYPLPWIGINEQLKYNFHEREEEKRMYLNNSFSRGMNSQTQTVIALHWFIRTGTWCLSISINQHLHEQAASFAISLQINLNPQLGRKHLHHK